MRRKKEKVVYEEDDGRTVADMNVEGMPWYRKDPQNTSGQIESMSSPEGKAALSGALLAVLKQFTNHRTGRTQPQHTFRNHTGDLQMKNCIPEGVFTRIIAQQFSGVKFRGRIF